MNRIHDWWNALPASISALIEIGIMFLPSLPAYLWIFPAMAGIYREVMQSLVYLYVLSGTLWIGLRRWRLAQLGVVPKGFWLGAVCGLVIVAGRTLVIISIDWGLPAPAFHWLSFLWETIFYFGFVALTEELLFRGLLYHLLESWKSYRWAIWGSAIGFSLWHAGQGPMVGAAMLFYGLIFALARWRAGGILGLILAHGMIDLSAARMLPTLEVASLGKLEICCTICLMLGLVLLVALPLYLWRWHPDPKRSLTG